MSLKDSIKTNLQNINKDSVCETLLIADIDTLLNETTKIDDEIVRQLSEIEDPLAKALSCYLEWYLKPKDNFGKIRAFLSGLTASMEKYSDNNDLNAKLFQIFVDKKIQFKLHDELENDLLDFKHYLDKTLDYKLVSLQKQILATFSNAITVLAKNGRLEKTRPIGLKINEICLALEKKYSSSERYDLERLFIEFRLKTNKILSIDDENSMRFKIAESYENEGDCNEKKGAGFGLVPYANAFMSYLDLGKKDRLEKVKAKLKSSGKTAKSSLKSIPIGAFEVSTKDWFQSAIPLIKYDSVLESIASLSVMYPRLKVPSDEEMGIAFQLMSVVVLDNDDNISAILEWDIDKKECQKFRAFQVLRIEETKYSFLRLQFCKYLLEVGLLSDLDIYQLIAASPIDDQLKEKLKLGVSRHFSQDFKSSAYILTLQLEPLFVALARNKANFIAVSHKQNRRGATQETTLGTLLENHRFRNIFDVDFYDLLQLYFVYDLGLNYRNELAHGLINHDKLSEEYSLTITLFICRILFMLVR